MDTYSMKTVCEIPLMLDERIFDIKVCPDFNGIMVSTSFGNIYLIEQVTVDEWSCRLIIDE